MNVSMRRLFLSEFTFWVALCAIGLYFLLPLRESLRFGIDLVGGTYLTLKVQTDKAVEAELAAKLQGIETKLRRSNKALPESKSVEGEAIVFSFANAQDLNEASMFIKDIEKEFTQKIEDKTLRLRLPDNLINRIKEEAVKKNIEVLRTRQLDPRGVAEIPIAAQGENIIVELPDVEDPQKAKAMIGTSAELDFRIVDKVAASKEDILYEFGGEIPDDKVILPGKGSREIFYLVDKYPEITGSMLRSADPSFGGDTHMDPIVKFSLTDEGGDKFYKITSRNPGKNLAIVLDGIVISAPQIKATLREGGYISGGFSIAETKELALLLKSGSFVAPVTFEEERQIGPSLGEESIRQGLMSCLVGLGLLLIFSIYYYKLSGLFAFIALLYNLVLILMGLAWLKATLTLPGIAGMVLTIGMAIDASILIFERIKEELAAGITIKKAVNTGFSGAMKVILDANITTFIVGVMLYNFGTGPIQGFAVTMMLGIVATLITGLFFLRSLFTFVIDAFGIQKLKI